MSNKVKKLSGTIAAQASAAGVAGISVIRMSGEQTKEITKKIIGEEIFLEKTLFNYDSLLWVVFAAVCPGIIAFTLYTLAQKQLGASLTGFTLYIFTVYAAIYGYFLFDEKLESYHYLGTALVFFGVYLAKKKNVKQS